MKNKQNLDVRYKVSKDGKKVTVTISTEGPEKLNNGDVNLSFKALIKALRVR